MENQREANFDLLRILSMIAVIVIHVSGRYTNADAMYSMDIVGEISRNHALFNVMVNVLSRFAVPCFLMLSGAFLLGNPHNANIKEFYRKSMKGIGMTTIIFSFIYIVYSLCKAILSSFVLQEKLFSERLYSIIKDIVAGVPFFHMWYMTVLIGIYLMVPIVIRIDDSLKHSGIDMYHFFPYVILFISSISYTTSIHNLQWDVGKQICYLPYLLVGYAIKKNITYKNNIKGAIFIGGG